MIKRFLIGLAIVFLMGFPLGCDQPAEGPGEGGGYEYEQQEQGQERQQQEEPGGF